MPEWNATTYLRVVFWTIAVILGIAEVWVVRHYLNPDAISYIEIASKYLQHDWTYAINSYWSPLYSWCIALAFMALRPAPYWEAAAAHLVVFLAYIGTLAAFEFFLHEVAVAPKDASSNIPACKLSQPVLYLGAYAAVLYAALSMVVVAFCSPDMIAFSLLLTATALLLRVRRTGGSSIAFVVLGITCGLMYLDRTALAPSAAISLLIVVVLLRAKGQPAVRPAAIIITASLITAGPFVFALLHKTHRFTLGDSGTLNYAWEISGVRRYLHWQGEPYDAGSPKHPTTRISSKPEAFSFAKPIPASYPPWFDPSYWYTGVRPKLKIKSQLIVSAVNFSVAAYYFVRSPILLPSCLIIVISGLAGWPRRLLSWWPVLVLALFGIMVYSFVFIEKRYIAANLLMIWVVLLASIPSEGKWLPKWSLWVLIACALAFTLLFVIRRQRPMVIDCLRDVKHREERWWNVDYSLARRLHELGLRPGDKVAYIGRTMDVEWARLGHYQIVAEVPIVYERNERLFDNSMRESTHDVEAFWNGDFETRERVLSAFRIAGAKIVVADGYFCAQQAAEWPRILSANEPHIPNGPFSTFTQVNSRYLWLAPHPPSSHLATDSNR